MKLSKGKEIKKLDIVFSRYIRLSHADHSGFVNCCTCGESMHWKYAHCGHFIKRGVHSTRFDERNVAPQCPGCNTYRGGEQAEYLLYIEETHGREAVDDLMRLKREWKQCRKWDKGVKEIREMQKEYKEKLDNLNCY